MRKIIGTILILLSSSLFAQITPEQLFESASRSCYVVVNKAGNTIGTGFLITNGYIITNHHVVVGASPTEITLRPVNNINEIIACEKLYVSSKRDIAIIKPLGTINNSGLEVDTITPKIGSNVYVIGNSEGLTGTFSDGLVSQIRDEEGEDTWIQMSAPISHGNSGGPVMSKDGKVIGMSTLSHRFGQNLNFAIPTKYIIAFLRTNGIEEVVKKSEEQSPPKEEKTKATSELDEVRALFTPEQIELVKEVDALYLERNLMLFIPLSILIILIVIILWKRKKSWVGNPASFKFISALIMMGLFIDVIFWIWNSERYPTFFKTKIEIVENHQWYLCEYSDDPIMVQTVTPRRKHRYSFLLNETYYGSDSALFFLAEGIFQGELIHPADTTEALKWFNALARKNYYPGYLFNAQCALNGWQSNEARKFINAIRDYSAGYANALAEILRDPNSSADEKFAAKNSMNNFIGINEKTSSGYWKYIGFDTIGCVFIDENRMGHSNASEVIKSYQWLDLYISTPTPSSPAIASHKKYQDGRGMELHSKFISIGKNLTLPWVLAKEYFIKAKNSNAINYTSKNRPIDDYVEDPYSDCKINYEFYDIKIKNWTKNDSIADYWLEKIKMAEAYWEFDNL